MYCSASSRSNLTAGSGVSWLTWKRGSGAFMQSSSPREGSVARSLDESICAEHQGLRDGQPEDLRRLEIDDQLICRRLLHGKIAGLRAFQYLVDQCGEISPGFLEVGPVGHEIAVDCEVFPSRDRGDPVPDGELGYRVPLKHDEGVRQRNDPVDAAAHHRVERGRDLGNAVHSKRL